MDDRRGRYFVGVGAREVGRKGRVMGVVERAVGRGCVVVVVGIVVVVVLRKGPGR